MVKNVKSLVDRSVDLGQTGSLAWEKGQPKSFGARSAQRLVCLRKVTNLFLSSNLDVL